MIIYATKQTMELYKLKTTSEFSEPFMRALVKSIYEKEQGDRLLEWGAKLFYFDRRKCIQVCNFASKFTVVLVDIKVDDLGRVGELITWYMMDIYSENKEMTKLLERLFKDSPIFCFEKLKDKSIISTLNHMQTGYLADGYRLYDYFDGNILQTKKLNRFINTGYPVTAKINGKTNYVFPAERFEQLLKERYQKQ